MISEGSSAMFAIVGVRATVFAVTCIYLGERVDAGAFVSRGGLRAIGVLLFFLGFASLFIA